MTEQLERPLDAHPSMQRGFRPAQRQRRFEVDLKVAMQASGLRSGWYQVRSSLGSQYGKFQRLPHQVW